MLFHVNGKWFMTFISIQDLLVLKTKAISGD